jgi:multiple sugar transport system substrate-binding protein
MGRFSKKLSRREFIGLGGAGLAGAAFVGIAGCGGGEADGSGGLIFSWGPEDTGTLQRLIDGFNEQSEFAVTWREMPADTTQYFDQLRTEFQAGGGDIDIIGGDVIWPAQFAGNGWTVDLSDRFDNPDDFLPAPIEANTHEGSLFGVPWYTDAGMLYYRQDLLEESGFSGPPETWEELKEMALKVREDAGIEHGFVFQGSEYEGGVVNGLEYIWNHGGDALDPEDPNRVVINSPEAIAGLTTARALIEEGVSPQAVSTYTEQESQNVFLNGNAVFMRNWPYIYGLAAEEASRVEQERIDITPLPVEREGMQSYSSLGGWNMFINAASDRQDEAWEFIRYITSAEIQKQFALDTARLPTLRSLYDDQEIIDSVPVIALGKEAIQNARPRPRSPFYSDMSLVMASQFTQSLNGETSPEEAVGVLEDEMQRIVERGLETQ